MPSAMSDKTGVVQVAVVEDHPGLRQALAALLDRLPGLRCEAVYPDGETAARAIPACRPDVVLLDLSLPGISAIECLRRLRSAGCEVPVIGFNQFHDADQAAEFLAAGGNGYLLKSASTSELLHAVRNATPLEPTAS
jgi:DNA-binding NarL/FixJ family response regulator